MIVRILAVFAAVATLALYGCASTQSVPSPAPVKHVDEASPATGGALFNGN